MPRQNQAIDLTKLRYVMYVRKSTEDENRQVRSIDDQKKDCEKLARDLGLNVVATIEERRSAKKPNQRKFFTQMINDIGKKYDAILAWHPDRLCRNMLEGGQIINMLDEGELKDIRFHSHQFSNDANGKMLLGMLFVFSKQYSDDLSAKVSRGVDGNFNEGKSAGTPKWGYDRSESSGLYAPNDDFDLIQNAWRKRANGESVNAIVDYLLDNNLRRMTKDKENSRAIKPYVSSTAKMFHDPFYYGVLVQANQQVDLRDIYDFKPMIDEATYNQVQMLSYGRTKDKSPKKRATFYPLHGMVYCAVCEDSNYMLVGKNKTGSGKYVLSYRCNNPSCTRAVKSFRAKHVFNSVYERLDKLELTDEAYERYSKRLDSMTDDKVIAIKHEIHGLRGAMSQVTAELNQRALDIVSYDKESPIYVSNDKRINELNSRQIDLKSKITRLEAKIVDPRQIKLSKAEFLNVVKTAADKMRAGSAVEKDVLCRILFLNLRVDNEKVASYLWNEPFASLVKATELSSGGGGRT